MASHFPFLGYGVGLRVEHYAHVLEKRPAIDWFEVISENFMVRGGNPRRVLDQVREHYPIVMHGVSLSIGSVDPLNTSYLAELATLARQVEPAWISDHLCWGSLHGHYAHDLLPLPYTEETLKHVSERVLQVQDYLRRPLVLENVSSYVTFVESEMAEWEFLTELHRRTSCGLLVDINNIFVSAHNHNFDAQLFLDALPVDAIAQVHLAGHRSEGNLLLDTHDHPVREEVWQLYRSAIEKWGSVSTLIEWDDQLPEFSRLDEERLHARAVADSVLCKTSSNQNHDATQPDATAVL